MQVVQSLFEDSDVKSIAQQIKSGDWGHTVTLELSTFLIETKPGSYDMNTSRQLQVKDHNIDYDFVDKLVTIISNSGDDEIDTPVVLFAPKPFTWEGKKYAQGYYLIGGTHTTCSLGRLGHTQYDFFIVNLEKDLDGDTKQIRRLGNLLNQREKLDQGLSDDCIKLEVYARMDERASQGLDVKLPKDEQKEFLETYPQISQQTISNWMAHHDLGGRRSPIRQWSKQSLDDNYASYKTMSHYAGYAVVRAHVIDDWNNSAQAQIINFALGNPPNPTGENKEWDGVEVDKILVPFYCKTVTQANNSIATKEKIDKQYEKLGKRLGITIETMVLPHD